MEKGSPKLNISLSRVAQHDKSQLNLNNSIQASPVVQSLNRKNLVMHIENCSRSVQLLGSPLKRIQEMRSQNSCLINGINNNVNNKSQSKFSTFIDKKAVGTAKTRQRPTQLGGITQVGVNQSTSLQHLHLVASPDSSQFHHQQQQQQLQQANHNINLQSSPQSTAHLSFLIKPGFQLNNINYSQNNRMANNSCSNIPTQSLINSMMNENQSQLFETSQIHNHNKQQSYGSSTNLRNHSHYQGQQQQLNIFQQFKNNFFKQPTFSHPSSTTNQDKRFSEQLNSKSTVKLMQLVQNQHETDTCPQNIFQNISQKAQMKNQSSSRNNQKLRKTNSMSMIRLRQSQDSFLDQIINGESHINQARVNCQAKKKKKTKKYGMATGGYVVSPTSLPSNSTPKTIAPNSAAATLSKMIQSSTNRIKSIPSPSTVHTHLQNKTLDSFKQYQILTNPTSSQSEQSPELFQKLKKKKMLLYQQNSKTNSNLLIVNEQIQKKQQKQQNMQQQKQIQNDDLNNKNNQNLQVIDQHQMLQQENYIQPFENTPSYQMWLLQQQQEQQYTQQPHFVDNTTIPISSQTLKNTASTLSQQSLTSGWQFSCQQLPFQIVNSCNLDGCTTNSNLKQSSKTNSLFDKLNQINKQSNKNLISSKNSTQNLPSQENFETQSNNLNFQVYSDQHQNKIQSIRNQESLKNNEGETFQNTHLVSRLKDLIGCQSNNSTQSPKTSSDSKKVEDCLTDNIVENDNNKSLNLTNQLMQSAQQIHIPLPSQALKSNQYDQYVSILEEFKNLQHDQNLQEFVDYLIVFARKYVKPIPQIVKNAQQISSQCKKKDEEVNKLKQEKLSILNEKNKQQQQKQFVQNDKMVPQYIQISQQNQQTLKELHTPSTQIEETSQQSLVIDQQTQIQMLKKQIEDKDNQLSNLIQRENVTIAYFKQLQKLGYLTISSSLASDSSERNRNGNTTSNIEDKKTGIDLSNHNTPHSINPLEYSGNKSPNPFNAYNQHNQQSEEKDYQFSSNFISIPSNDNESNKIQQQYLQSHFQKMAQNHSQNHENFLSEQPSSIRQSSGKSYQNQQEINQQFNQWLKFINNKKKVQTKQQSQFNVLNKVSPQNQIDTKKQNNGCNKYQQNTQTNYLNPDFSMNLDHSQPTQTNSVSDRNSNEMHQNKILNMKTNQVKTEAIDERKNKDQHISRAIEQVLQRNQSNQIIPKLENTKQDKIEIQKDLDNSMQRYTAAAVDKYIDPQGEGIQQESQNPQFKFQLNNQMSLEDYKKKTSKLSSVSNSARNSFTSKSSFIDDDDDDQNKLEIQNKIFSAQLELQQRYNQTMIIKSKSSSNLNENIRQKLKLDLSILKSPQSSKNQLTQGKIIGFQQNNNLESLQQQQAKQQEVPEQNQVMDYYDEFMSKIDEFSLSWRKAVIDESQKYQNRDNPFKKQQLIDQQKQLQ